MKNLMHFHSKQMLLLLHMMHLKLTYLMSLHSLQTNLYLVQVLEVLVRQERMTHLKQTSMQFENFEQTN